MEEKKKNSNGIIIVLATIILVLLVVIFLIGTGKLKFNSNEDPSKEQANNQNNNINETNNDNSQKNVDNSNQNNNTSQTNNVSKQKSSVSKSQILSYYKERISAFSDSNHQYSVVDINNDDIPELFIYVTGTIGNQIIADVSVYTYDENKGNKSSNYIVEAGIISGRVDNNTVLYKMNDGRLLSVYGHMGYETATYFKLENDWLLRTGFASKETDSYTTGDKEIQFKACNDTSLIDNFI